MGGQAILQGVPERPPVRITVPQVWLHASSEAAVGALIAHARMLRTGEPQFVDVSAQTTMIWSMMQAMEAHAIQGREFERMGAVLQLGTIALPLCYECADGHVVALPNGVTIERMVGWMAEEGVVPPEWVTGEEWRTYDIRMLQGQTLNYSFEEVMDATTRYLKLHTKAELMDRGLREGVTIAPVNTVEDLLSFEQLNARGYFVDAPLPNGSTVRAAGLPAKASESPLTIRRQAPALGEHTSEINAEPPRSSESAPPAGSESANGRAPPLRRPEGRRLHLADGRGRSPPSTSPTTERPSFASRRRARPAAFAPPVRTRTACPARTAPSSSATSTPPS